MSAWPPFTRDDLLQAAASGGFDMTFPTLIRRLVAETAVDISRLDMPAESGTAAGGFDGVVETLTATTWVPDGTSVWELSVQQSGAQGKADIDYGKRDTGPDDDPPDQITYVEVILAKWTKATTWSKQRTKERRWRAVKGYNVDGVLTWLEGAPATTVWLANKLLRTLPGVQLLDQWWDETWLPSTRTPLDSDILLAGRQAAAADIRARLAAGPPVVTVGGDLPPTEAAAVIAASLDGDRTAHGEALRARTLLVTDDSSLAVLLQQPQPLVLVLMDPALTAGLPLTHPHRVVLLGAVGARADVVVPRVDAAIAEEHLRASGATWEDAARLAALARRSVSALRRVLSLHPATLTPVWARQPDLTTRRVLLAGAWNGAVNEDRQALETLVGKSYAEVGEAAMSLAASPDAPLLGHVDELWHLQAPSDAWSLLASALTRDDLTAFVTVASAVLSERDPLVHTSGADRLTRQLAGQRQRYSDALRQGIAETLALLGATDDDALRPGGRDCSEWAATVLVPLWRAANAEHGYDLWASLYDVLPVLAEAAPDSFLRAMRGGLAGADPLHARMFVDRDGGDVAFGPTPVHSAFLWALEILAWSADHFDEAVDVLASLAAIDPGGSWANRPSRSLAEIFSCWAPNTTADESQRLAALRRVLRDHPEVGRTLLLSLVPGQGGFQSAHRAPRHRDWKIEPAVTRPDLVRTATAVIDLLLSDLGDDPDRLVTVIGRLDDMSPAHRQVVADQLVRLGSTLQDEEIRLRLWTALHDVTVKHREYRDAVWALPESELLVLDGAADAVRPSDPVLAVLWLFASDWITLGDFTRREDIEAYDVEVRRRREAALSRVLEIKSLDGVRELAVRVEFGHTVGTTLAAVSPDVDGDMVAWLADGAPSERAVAFAYLGERLRDPDQTVFDRLLGLTPRADVRAELLRATFDPARAWRKLDELESAVSEHYWWTFTYTGLGHDFPELVAAAEGLLGAGRYAATLRMLSLYARRMDDTTAQAAADMVARACEGLLAGGFEDPETRALSRHDYQQALALLARHRDNVGRSRVLNIEWQYFPVLGYGADAPSLHTALAEDAAFFVEMLGYLTPVADDTAEDGDAEQSRQRSRELARQAYDVLQSWRRVPGLGADGNLDADALKAWIYQARGGLREAELLTDGDEAIGRVLSRLPAEPDGTTPPVVVRDLLEELVSDDIDEGLVSAILQRRSTTTRGATEGGAQERVLAEQCRTEAAAATAWPRTRSLLRHLQRVYEGQARRADDDAEHRRRDLPG